MAGWVKQAISYLNVSVSRKLQEIRPKVLFMISRKLHMRFRMIDYQDRWHWITLNSISLNFQIMSQISYATTAKRMKIDKYCQRQRCKHVKLEQFLACFRVARVSQRQPGFLVHTGLRIPSVRRLPVCDKDDDVGHIATITYPWRQHVCTNVRERNVSIG